MHAYITGEHCENNALKLILPAVLVPLVILGAVFLFSGRLWRSMKADAQYTERLLNDFQYRFDELVQASEIAFDDLTMEEEIGKGSLGVVWRARWKSRER
jgi:hypothetical protein